MSSEAIELSPRGVLESNTLLNALTEEQMVELAGHCKLKRCERSELIWGTGKEVGFFGIVGTGFVKMVKSTSAGIEMTMEIIGPGQAFGMLSAIEGSGCPLAAYGMTDTTYLRVPKKEFLDVYRVNSALKDQVLNRTAARMHQKIDFISMLSSGSVEQRLASILFLLAESFAEREGGCLRLSIPLTRQALAEMAGTTTESTIRVLSRWTSQGLIDTEKQQISILDVDALQRRLQGMIMTPVID